jgi:hypothetical protein
MADTFLKITFGGYGSRLKAGTTHLEITRYGSPDAQLRI